MPNFPEDVSENLVRLFIEGQYGWECQWNKTTIGDLCASVPRADGTFTQHTFEVKCVNSLGPISFSSRNHWDALYILEWRNLQADELAIYECRASPSDLVFSQIPINVRNSETFGTQRTEKRRPRLTLAKVKKHLGGALTTAFEGTIEELLGLDSHK